MVFRDKWVGPPNNKARSFFYPLENTSVVHSSSHMVLVTVALRSVPTLGRIVRIGEPYGVAASSLVYGIGEEGWWY